MPQVRFPTPPHLSTSHRACCNQQFLYKLHPARFINNKTSFFGYFISKFTLPSYQVQAFGEVCSWDILGGLYCGVYREHRLALHTHRTSHNLTTFLRQSDKLGLGWSGNCKNIGGSEGESCSWALFHSARKIVSACTRPLSMKAAKSKAVCRDYTA